MHAAPIKVLVVEDSLTVQLLLTEAIEADGRLQVVNRVATGEQALEFVKASRPDVVLMDVHLPGINGFEATRRIMATTPVPIVICSAVSDPDDVATTFEAMEAGAVAVVAKPGGLHSANQAEIKRHLVETLRLMAEVKVVRRWGRAATRRPVDSPQPAIAEAARHKTMKRVVAIGTSTGGPPVLRTILSELPASFPLPILVVQHISPGFLPGLVEWLGTSCALPLEIAAHGAPLLGGHVYFGPDGFHLGVNAKGHIALAKRAADDHLCPSVAHLLRSVTETYGAGGIGVLLTGMGSDGAAELAELRQRGGTTIAQDKNSSVVHGMPGEAIRLGAATHILPAGQIAGELVRLAFP